MKRVIIESPFSGDIKKNLDYARLCCKDCVRRGEVPFASHLFFPQFLDDDDPAQRKLGTEMGYDFWDKADIIVFYLDLGMSPGMKDALAKAFSEGRAIERRAIRQVAAHVPTEALPSSVEPPPEVKRFAPKKDELEKGIADLVAQTKPSEA